MKKIYALFLIPNFTFAAATPPLDGAYFSKIENENVCIEIENDGEGAYLTTPFGTEYCLPNQKESKGDYTSISQFRCVETDGSGYSEGFMGTFSKNSITFLGTSDIISSGSSLVEQADYFFAKKYTFKYDTKGVCGNSRVSKSSSTSQPISNKKSLKKALFN